MPYALPPLSRSQKRRLGLTLTEAAIVLAILGIVLGALWAAAMMVYRNMQVGQTAGNLITVVQNVRSFYSAQNAFTKGAGTEMTADFVNAEIFPSMMIDTVSKLPKSLWGTAIRVYVGPEATRTTFRITFDPSLPEEVCRNLAGRVAGQGRAEGLVNVTAGGSSFSTTDELNNLTPTSLNGSCKTVDFTFKLKG